MSIDPRTGDGIAEVKDKRGRFSGSAWFLLILPLGIAVGSIWGLHRHFTKQKENTFKVSQEINVDGIKSDLTIYTKYISKRGFDSAVERDALGRASVSVEGEIDFLNSTLRTKQKDSANYYISHERIWHTHWVDITGRSKDCVVIAVAYQGDATVGGAGKLAVMFSLVKAFAEDKFDKTLRFAFIPKQLPAEEVDGWLRDRMNEKILSVIYLSELEYSQGFTENVWLLDNQPMAELTVSSRPRTLTHSVLGSQVSFNTSTLTTMQAATIDLKNRISEMMRK